MGVVSFLIEPTLMSVIVGQAYHFAQSVNSRRLESLIRTKEGLNRFCGFSGLTTLFVRNWKETVATSVKRFR